MVASSISIAVWRFALSSSEHFVAGAGGVEPQDKVFFRRRQWRDRVGCVHGGAPFKVGHVRESVLIRRGDYGPAPIERLVPGGQHGTMT